MNGGWYCCWSLFIFCYVQGSRACFARDIPFSAIYFPLYANMKKFTANKDGYNGIGTLLLSATIAGLSVSFSHNSFKLTEHPISEASISKQNTRSVIFTLIACGLSCTSLLLTSPGAAIIATRLFCTDLSLNSPLVFQTIRCWYIIHHLQWMSSNCCRKIAAHNLGECVSSYAHELSDNLFIVMNCRSF